MERFVIIVLITFGLNSVSIAQTPPPPPQNAPSAAQSKAPKLKPAPPIKWQRSSQCKNPKS